MSATLTTPKTIEHVALDPPIRVATIERRSARSTIRDLIYVLSVHCLAGHNRPCERSVKFLSFWHGPRLHPSSPLPRRPIKFLTSVSCRQPTPPPKGLAFL